MVVEAEKDFPVISDAFRVALAMEVATVTGVDQEDPLPILGAQEIAFVRLQQEMQSSIPHLQIRRDSLDFHVHFIKESNKYYYCSNGSY